MNPQPVKICFVSLFAYHFFNPSNKSRFGGAELQLYYLATELARDPQFEVHFIVGDFGHPEFEIKNNVRLHKFFNPKKGVKFLKKIFGFVVLWRLLKTIKADLYIQRTSGIETGITSLFCALYKKKFFYMIGHNLDLEMKKPDWMPGLNGLIRWKLLKLGLAKASLIVAQHETQKKNLKRQYNKDGPIRLSAHPIPNEQEINLSRKEFILWVARCDRWKQPEIFTSLAREFPDEKFLMVCQAAKDISYFKEVEKGAKALTNMQFFDYVPFDEIDNYFLKAKLFINTSKNEGFPNTFIQAAKYKTPILSLAVDPDDLLEVHRIGIQAHNNIAQLKKGLADLLSNQSLWQEYAENAYRYAQTHHDLKKIIEQDKAMIFKILKDHD